MDPTLEFLSDSKTCSLDVASKGEPDGHGFGYLFGERFLESTVRSNKRILATSVLIFIVVLLLTYPKYLELLSDPDLKSNYAYFFDKVDAPLTPVVGSSETHGAKMDFRLTVPLLAKVIGVSGENTKSVIFIFIIQTVLLIPFLFALIKLLLQYLSPTLTLSFVIGVSSIYLAKAFIWDYDFWFDGYAYFFLVLGMFFRNRLAIFSTLTLACWTDERAVVALSSIYLFHFLLECNFDLRSFGEFWRASGWIQRKSTTILLVGLSYVALRFFLTSQFGLHTPIGEDSGVAISLIPYQLKHRLIGVVLSFEGLWALFLIAIVQLVRNQRSFLASVVVGLMIIQTLIAYSVFDISRSMTYAFPLMIIAAVLLNKHGILGAKNLYMAASVLCILIPTQYLIFFPRQIPWAILSFAELSLVTNGLIFL